MLQDDFNLGRMQTNANPIILWWSSIHHNPSLFFFAWALRFLLGAHIIINQRLWGRTQWIAESGNSWYETGYPASTHEKKLMRIQWPPPEECQTFLSKSGRTWCLNWQAIVLHCWIIFTPKWMVNNGKSYRHFRKSPYCMETNHHSTHCEFSTAKLGNV